MQQGGRSVDQGTCKTAEALLINGISSVVTGRALPQGMRYLTPRPQTGTPASRNAEHLGEMHTKLAEKRFDKDSNWAVNKACWVPDKQTDFACVTGIKPRHCANSKQCTVFAGDSEGSVALALELLWVRKAKTAGPVSPHYATADRIGQATIELRPTPVGLAFVLQRPVAIHAQVPGCK
ncbi:UNVERIFIED_CONTAM: hypothetical protein FKN15_020467 [Acipenser sinensis]